MKEYQLVELGTLISKAKTAKCGNESYPVLSMTMHDGLIFQDEKFKKVIASKDKSNYKVVYRNQLVISFPIDEGVLATQRITDAGIVSPAYGVWDINQTKVLPEYLEYALRSERAINYYKSKLRGSTARRRSLPTPTLLAFTIPLPSINEQLAVLDIIHKSKSILERRKQEIYCLDELVKARFVEMFGDPVDNPKGWQKRKLQEIVADDCTISYGIVQTGDNQGEGIPVFRPVDIVNKIPKLQELKKTTPEISAKYKRTILQGRELLITVRANIADTCIVGNEFKGCNVGRGIVPVRTKEDIISLEFLKAEFDNKHFNDNIKSLAKGITLIQLNMEDLRNIKLIIPPIEMQRKYVSLVCQINKSKFEIKRGICHEYLK